MARVLVIDDDEMTRTLVTRMLAGEGHQVEEAVDGAEGLRLFGPTLLCQGLFCRNRLNFRRTRIGSFPRERSD